MKKIIAILSIISLLFILGAGCSTTDTTQIATEDTQVQEDINEDLDSSDLDNLENDLDTVDW